MSYASTDSGVQAVSRQPASATDQSGARANIDAVKARMKAMWMDGDYARFATYMEPGARHILAGWNITAGERLLDVGCGAGQIGIPAARAGVQVTGVDIATNLVVHARRRAETEGLDARFDEGDAEALPYTDGSFDVVTSMFGAMFAPRPHNVVTEMARVCRPGGRLFMANWTPSGMAGPMFRQIAARVPPPPGVTPPSLWGDEDTVTGRLSDRFHSIRLTRKLFPMWKFPFSVTELVDHYRRYFGPVKRAFEALDDAGQQSLRADLAAVFSAHNQSRGGTVELRGEYLEVAAVRKPEVGT